MKTNVNKHSKKRNALLVYEFLVRTVSQGVIDGNDDKSQRALKIVKKFYKPGTELYREFRLLNSLVKSTVSSEPVAASILSEAKIAARECDVAQLDREKSFLIKAVNLALNSDGLFFEQQVPNYKACATVQTLVNCWRAAGKADLRLLSEYEDKVVKMLTVENKQSEETRQRLIESVGSGLNDKEVVATNRLVYKIMTQKLNDKYSGSLNDNQRKLLKEYVFSCKTGDVTQLKNSLIELKVKLVSDIHDYVTQNETSDELKRKLETVKEQLNEVDFSTIQTVSDEQLTQFMMFAKLLEEIASPEDSVKQEPIEEGGLLS